MDFTQLFEVADQDYAIQLLTRIFGDIVPFVMGDSSVDPANGTWLTDLIAIYNQAILLIALVIGSYTTYVMIFDTAADGTVFGSSSDTKYTILRALLGAIAFIPVSGGYTLAQLIVVWLFAQGSALGDVGWRSLANNTLSSEQVLSASTPLSTHDFMVRGQFSTAMYALTAGELCRYELNQIAENAARSNKTPINRKIYIDSDLIIGADVGISFGTPVAMRKEERQIYFSSDDESYGLSDNLCGSVAWNEIYNAAGASGSANFSTQVGSLLINARLDATDTAIFNNLVPAARSLANTVHNGSRDEEAFKTAFSKAVDAAFSSYMAGGGALSNPQFQKLNSDLLSEMDELGWAMALSWHRGITMASIESHASLHDLEINSRVVQNAKRYFRGLGAWVNGRSSGIDRAAFSQLETNFAYLSQFEAFVIELGLPEKTAVTTAMNGGNANAEGIINIVYQTVLGWFSAGGPQAAYIDPMSDIAGLGKTLMGTGGVMVAGSNAINPITAGLAGASLGSSVPGAGTVAGGAAGFTLGGVLKNVLSSVGWLLIGSGFFLLSILPAIPMIYFFTAVISWLALVIESMFAIPLAVLAYFAPARESSLIGPWNKMLLNLFGILLRPIFTIVGFVASLVLMRVGIDFLYILFSGFLMFLSSGSGIWSAVVSVGLIISYVVAALVLILFCSSLITDLGDAAMHWIGVGMSQLGKMEIGQQVQSNLVGAGAMNRINGGGRALRNSLTPNRKDRDAFSRQLRDRPAPEMPNP